ncbi:lysostaphin resistance A-like protein [Lactobacillus sp. PSON]|uniref:lysostaphin resistance A-like protein n=1 Tax=Lactobacillus sp. PSON TaxID=3455454 RepID=UPI004041B0E6
MRKFLHYAGNIAGMIIAFVLYAYLQSFYFFPKKIHMPMKSVGISLITVIVLWLIFWLYKQQLKYVNYWGFNEEPHWKWKKVLIAFIGFILITIGAVITLNLVSGGKTVSTNQQELNKISLQSGIMFKIMVGFIAPFCEEVIFRGMFFNTFFTKATSFNKWAGILVSGFVFAFMHDPALSKFILVYWVLGCVLGWVYLQTKDLRYSMMTHMAYNLLGVI